MFINSKFPIFKGDYENLQRLQDDMINSKQAKEREITHQQSLLDAEMKKAEDLAAEIEKKKIDLGNLRNKLTETNKTLDETTNKLTQLNTKKTNLENLLPEMRKQLEIVEKEYNVAREKVQNQDAKVQKIRQNIDTLELQKTKLCSDIEHATNKLKQHRVQMTNNSKSIEQLRDDAKKLNESKTNSEKL
ncbi:unnamed protein product, partial [Rotaria sp. Silwood1]